MWIHHNFVLEVRGDPEGGFQGLNILWNRKCFGLFEAVKKEKIEEVQKFINLGANPNWVHIKYTVFFEN